jgi:hypothetical protein
VDAQRVNPTGEGSNQLKRYSQPDGERGFSERLLVVAIELSLTNLVTSAASLEPLRLSE